MHSDREWGWRGRGAVVVVAKGRKRREGERTANFTLAGDLSVGIDLDLWASPGNVEVDLLDHVCGGGVEESSGGRIQVAERIGGREADGGVEQFEGHGGALQKTAEWSAPNNKIRVERDSRRGGPVDQIRRVYVRGWREEVFH